MNSEEENMVIIVAALKIKKLVIYIMLFTRHSEFYHQSFDIFVTHISVFKGGKASIPQMWCVARFGTICTI